MPDKVAMRENHFKRQTIRSANFPFSVMYLLDSNVLKEAKNRYYSCIMLERESFIVELRLKELTLRV